MKNSSKSFLIIFKVAFLILLLVLGWVFVNITNLFKSKKISEIFSPNKANADDPHPPDNSY